jgi:hypothetical protein
MATTIVPAVSRALPTFTGSKRDDFASFLQSMECAFSRERPLYDDAIAPIAKKSLLVEGCRGKAARFIKGLPQDKKDTWDHLVASLREKYETPNAYDRARAGEKVMRLRQKSGEDLSTYARRAKKLAAKVDGTMDKVVADHFVLGIRSKYLRVTVAANSQTKDEYTFKDVYQAVKAVARASRKKSSESESDTSSSSSTSTSSDSSDDSIGARRHHHHHHNARKDKEFKNKESKSKESKNKESKAAEVEVKPTPVPFNMDDLSKLIKEAIQASTREFGVGGPYGNPVQQLGQPLQAPLIESYAVASGSSRPPFQNRGYQYGGQQGQQQGGYPQQAQQQVYSRPSNITCYNCEERGHGYQQCPKPP